MVIYRWKISTVCCCKNETIYRWYTMIQFVLHKHSRKVPFQTIKTASAAYRSLKFAPLTYSSCCILPHNTIRTLAKLMAIMPAWGVEHQPLPNYKISFRPFLKPLFCRDVDLQRGTHRVIVRCVGRGNIVTAQHEQGNQSVCLCCAVAARK